MPTHRVSRVQNVRADPAVPVHERVGVRHRGLLIRDRLVGENRHLRHAVVAHDAIAVDACLQQRALENTAAVHEVLEDVLAGVSGGVVGRALGSRREESRRVVRAFGLELALEVLLRGGILAGEAEDAVHNELRVLAAISSFDDARNVGRQSAQSGAGEAQLWRVLHLQLCSPLAGQCAAGVTIQCVPGVWAEAEARVKHGADRVDGGMARLNASREGGKRPFVVRHVQVQALTQSEADVWVSGSAIECIAWTRINIGAVIYAK